MDFPLWRWLGALHPVVIHFPIALLLAAGLLEAAAAWSGGPASERFRAAAGINLGLGAAGAVVAAACGWLDAAHLGFEPALRPVLAWHRWLGTAAAAGAVGVVWLRLRSSADAGPKPLRAYRIALWGVGLAVAIAGHLGGTLVYGLDYYSGTP